jgi:predicted aldo/keto reductase-like oxidoreductase
VKHLVVSAHDRSTYKAHLDRNVFDLIMVRYNAAHRGADRDVFPFLPEDHPPGVICYNSTRWGNLFDPQWMPDGERTPTPVDLYRYVLSNPHIQMVLTAPETFDQLKENVKTLEAGPVTDEERQWLERIGDHVHPLNPNTNFDFLFPGRGLKKKNKKK